MTRAVSVVALALLGVAPAAAASSRIGIANLERGELRDRLEQTVLFSLEFTGLDYEAVILRPTSATEAAAALAAAAVDLVVTIGADGPAVAAALPQHLPVIATGVPHPDAFGRRGRLTGTSHYVPPARQLAFFRKLLPGLARLAVLRVAADADGKRLLAETRRAAGDLHMQVVDGGVLRPSDLSQRLRLSSPDVDAFLLLGEGWSSALVGEAVAVAAVSGRPLFAFSEELVHRGAVASLYADRVRLAEQVGVMAKAMLADRRASSPSVRTLPYKIALNLRSARALGFRVPYTVLVIADDIVR